VGWRRWYRVPWPDAAGAVGLCLVFLGYACLGFATGAVRNGIIVAGIAVVCGYFALCYLRGGVGVSSSGVTVRNLAGLSVHVPWPEVAGFRIVRKRSRGTYYELEVVCRNGRVLHTTACAWSWWTKRSWPTVKARMDHIVNTLEAIRVERAARAADPASTA